MSDKLYVGEGVTWTIDLDASADDTDYGLGVAPVLRIAPPGIADAAFEVTCTISDAEAGTVTAVISDADSALLWPGDWVRQVQAGDTGLVLFEDTITVYPSIGEEATGDDVPTEPEPGFAAYLAAGGATVPASAWRRYRADAWRVLQDVTYGRVDDPGTYITDATALALAEASINEAVFRTADALYRLENDNMQSGKLGNYSYTRGTVRTQADADAVAMRALRGTGLTYRGVLSC